MNTPQTFTIGASVPLEVEIAEDNFTDHVRLAEDQPHRWGEEQQAESARLANILRRLYDKHNVPELERNQSI